jgi:hypothetical protein
MLLFATVSGCASGHFFPRCQPLFAGLSETAVPAGARGALAEAKEDFQCGRCGEAPRHARYVTTLPYTHSRVYEGRGYRLTLVDKRLVTSAMKGPEIVVDATITGGGVYRYDEIDLIQD